MSNGFPVTISSEGGGVLEGGGGAVLIGTIHLTHNRQNFPNSGGGDIPADPPSTGLPKA